MKNKQAKQMIESITGAKYCRLTDGKAYGLRHKNTGMPYSFKFNNFQLMVTDYFLAA